MTVTGSDGVELHKLTVDGDWQAGQVAGGADFNGITYVNAAGTVADVTIREIGDTPSGDQVSGNQRGNALQVSNTTQKTFSLIDSTLTLFQKTGAVIRNADVTISGNDVTAPGIQHVMAQNGIQLSHGTTGDVTGNHFSGIGFDGGNWSVTDIMVFDGNGLNITGNFFTGTGANDIAIYLNNVQGSTVSGNAIGGMAPSIPGADYGIYLYNSGGNAVANNDFANGDYGILEYGVISSANTVDNTSSNANSYTNIAQINHYLELDPASQTTVVQPAGSEGVDWYVGGAGNDMLTGNGGDDHLEGKGGADTMLGGAGDDTIVYTAGDGTDASIDGGSNSIGVGDALQVAGTAGADTIKVTLDGSNVVNRLSSNADALPVAANVAGVEHVTLDLKGGNDTLDYTGTTQAVTVNLSGTQTATGFDTVAGVENVTGGSGGDTLTGSSGGNTIRGGGGADVLDGNGGIDQLFGGAGADSATFAVASGDQATFDGGADTDTQTVNGTSAAETYYVNPISGGHLGIDVDPTGSDGAATDANFEVSTIDVEEIVINTGAGADTVIISGDLGGTGVSSSTVKVYGGADGDVIDASGMTGAPIHVEFYGEGGDDTLTGGSANDLLVGGAGADTLKGGLGNDTLIGNTSGNPADAGDKAIFNDGATGYEVTINSDGSAIVKDTNTANGNEGTDTLWGVAQLQFGSDAVIDLGANVLVYDGHYAGTGAGVLKASYASIGAALAASGTHDNDTIVVREGTYAENLSITKGVTILGAQHGVAGTAHTGFATGTGESTISGQWTIATTNSVVIDGLRFLNVSPEGVGSDASLAINSAGSGTQHKVINSVFYSTLDGGDRAPTTGSNNDGDPVRDDRAIHIGMSATDGAILIQDNYVTGSMTGKYGTASWGRGIWADLNGVDLTVDHNTFENSRTGLNFDRYAGDLPVISANTFTNDGTAITYGVNWPATITGITGSVMNNVDLEFNFQNLSSPITFDIGAAVSLVQRRRRRRRRHRGPGASDGRQRRRQHHRQRLR